VNPAEVVICEVHTVQELMGHKTIQMTVRYAHLAPKHQLADLQRLCKSEDAQEESTDTKTDTVGFSTKTT